MLSYNCVGCSLHARAQDSIRAWGALGPGSVVASHGFGPLAQAILQKEGLPAAICSSASHEMDLPSASFNDPRLQTCARLSYVYLLTITWCGHAGIYDGADSKRFFVTISYFTCRTLRPNCSQKPVFNYLLIASSRTGNPLDGFQGPFYVDTSGLEPVTLQVACTGPDTTMLLLHEAASCISQSGMLKRQIGPDQHQPGWLSIGNTIRLPRDACMLLGGGCTWIAAALSGCAQQPACWLAGARGSMHT